MAPPVLEFMRERQWTLCWIGCDTDIYIWCEFYSRSWFGSCETMLSARDEEWDEEWGEKEDSKRIESSQTQLIVEFTHYSTSISNRKFISFTII
jgi:hypothetical protein